MQKSRKLVLLSTLISPGLAQFYLLRKILGAVLAGAATIVIYRIILVMLEKAKEISASIERDESAPTIISIMEAVAMQLINAQSFCQRWHRQLWS